MLLWVDFQCGIKLIYCALDHLHGIRAIPEVSELEQCPSPSRENLRQKIYVCQGRCLRTVCDIPGHPLGLYRDPIRHAGMLPRRKSCVPAPPLEVPPESYSAQLEALGGRGTRERVMSPCCLENGAVLYASVLEANGAIHTALRKSTFSSGTCTLKKGKYSTLHLSSS